MKVFSSAFANFVEKYLFRKNSVCILKYLDKVKVSVVGKGNLLSVEIRVDTLIRKGDTLSEPD